MHPYVKEFFDVARAFFGWDPGRFGLAFDVALQGDGRIVVTGTPEEVVACEASPTGRILAREFAFQHDRTFPAVQITT